MLIKELAWCYLTALLQLQVINAAAAAAAEAEINAEVAIPEEFLVEVESTVGVVERTRLEEEVEAAMRRIEFTRLSEMPVKKLTVQSEFISVDAGCDLDQNEIFELLFYRLERNERDLPVGLVRKLDVSRSMEIYQLAGKKGRFDWLTRELKMEWINEGLKVGKKEEKVPIKSRSFKMKRFDIDSDHEVKSEKRDEIDEEEEEDSSSSDSSESEEEEGKRKIKSRQEEFLEHPSFLLWFTDLLGTFYEQIGSEINSMLDLLVTERTKELKGSTIVMHSALFASMRIAWQQEKAWRRWKSDGNSGNRMMLGKFISRGFKIVNQKWEDPVRFIGGLEFLALRPFKQEAETILKGELDAFMEALTPFFTSNRQFNELYGLSGWIVNNLARRGGLKQVLEEIEMGMFLMGLIKQHDLNGVLKAVKLRNVGEIARKSIVNIMLNILNPSVQQILMLKAVLPRDDDSLLTEEERMMKESIEKWKREILRALDSVSVKENEGGMALKGLKMSSSKTPIPMDNVPKSSKVALKKKAVKSEERKSMSVSEALNYLFE